MVKKLSIDTILNDPKRLEKLRSLDLLDTEADPAFDRLTRLASRVLKAPVSLVSLIDVDRQFFKSQFGLPEPWASLRQTPLSHSFCQHVMASGEPLIIEDARLHDLVRDNLAIRDLGVIAYAGIPLITSDNHALGSFCVIDAEPRVWSENEIDILRDLAASVMAEIELRNELQERRKAQDALRESEAQYRQILDAIWDLVILKDLDSRILWANKAFRDYYGMTNEELRGIIDAPFVPSEYTEQYVLNDAYVAESGQPLDIPEEPVTRYDGMVRLFNTIKTPIFDEHGEVSKTVGVSRDITDRKRVEQELRLALDREIEINELKSRFSSMASHEFRTPLMVILSSTKILQEYSHQLTEEKQRSHLDRIQRQVDRLVTLLDDMLAISKAESMGLDVQPEPVDLPSLCHEIRIEMQQTTDQHQITFSVNGVDRLVYLDTKLMRQALSNLLSNAVKYSPAGGTVRFELSYLSDQIVFLVQDEGIGIPESDRDAVFETFQRASNVGEIAGTGLGLAIVKRAVEAHGGTVQVESAMGRGTTFILTLPTLQNTKDSVDAPVLFS